MFKRKCLKQRLIEVFETFIEFEEY